MEAFANSPKQQEGTHASERKEMPPSFRDELKNAVQTFAQTTSVKGIPKAMKTKSHFLKCVWILGTLMGLGCALFLVITLTLAYFAYDTVVKIEKCVDCKPEFPDITVCNLNILASLAALDQIDYAQYFNYTIDFLWGADASHNFSELSPEQQLYLNQLYTTRAYMGNYNIDDAWEYLWPPTGLAVFVHGCQW